MKTVRVRIAVVVNSDADWAAFGSFDHDDKESQAEAHGFTPEMFEMATYFIEADLPIPEPMTVQGEVVK